MMIPISAMVMVITIGMIIAILVIIPVLVLIAALVIIPVLVLIVAVMRPRLTDSSRHESGKENGHYQQHSAVMPRYFIFHIHKVMDFMGHCDGVFTP